MKKKEFESNLSEVVLQVRYLKFSQNVTPGTILCNLLNSVDFLLSLSFQFMGDFKEDDIKPVDDYVEK